jgi:hypothetical protein
VVGFDHEMAIKRNLPIASAVTISSALRRENAKSEKFVKFIEI